MSYYEQLNASIAEKIADLTERGEPLVGQWIAHAVCDDYKDGLAENEAAEFWQHGGYRTVREEVRRHIGKRFKDTETKSADHPTLPGFEHLRTAYMVERDGDEQVIPVFNLTDEEIDGKAELYRSMGAACYAHADEFERFKRWRVEHHLTAAE